MTGSLRFARHELAVWRRTWHGSAFTVLVAPLLYLASIGLGLGRLVEDGGSSAALGGVTYAAFAGTGLIVASAMQTAAGDMSWPVFGAIKYTRTWLAVVATPLSPADLIGGKIVVLVMRLTASATAFAVALAALGVLPASSALQTIPPAVLTGTAVGALIGAVAAGARRDFTIGYVFRFVLTPLFILSGTFFPVSGLPPAAQPLAALSPLWHGIELARAAALDLPTALPPAVHVIVLVALVVAGAALSVRLLTARLHP